MFNLEQRIQGNFITLCNCPKGGCIQVGVGLLSQVTRDRMRGCGLKFAQERFRLGNRKKFFIKRIVKHWNRLCRVVMVSLSLEGFKNHVDETLRDMV